MSGLLVARRGSLWRHRPEAAAGYAAEVLADNPVGYWRFEETSGSTFADEISTNDGTVFGADLSAAGQVGSGISFDGTDDYCTIPHDADFSFSNGQSITLEMMVYRNSDATHGLLSKGAFNGVAAERMNYQLLSIAGSGTRFYYRDNTLSSTNHWYEAPVLATGEWVHLVFRYTFGTASTAKFSFNGTAQTGSWGGGTGNVAPHTQSQPITLAASRDSDNNNGNFLAGRQDEFAIYRGLLSDARILAHAQAAGLA